MKAIHSNRYHIILFCFAGSRHRHLSSRFCFTVRIQNRISVKGAIFMSLNHGLASSVHQFASKKVLLA